jgi:hypothetical protein
MLKHCLFLLTGCLWIVPTAIQADDAPLSIEAADYEPETFQPRKTLENYYGLPIPGGGKMTAAVMAELSAQERASLIGFSAFPEKACRQILMQMLEQRQTLFDEIAVEKAKGKSLDDYVGLTLDDGTVVTAKMLAELSPMWKRQLLARSAPTDSLTQTRRVQDAFKRLSEEQAKEKKALDDAPEYDRQQAVLRAEQRRAQELLRQQQVQHDAQKAEFARQQAEQKAERERKAVEREEKRARLQAEREKRDQERAERQAESDRKDAERAAKFAREEAKRHAETAQRDAERKKQDDERREREAIAAKQKAEREEAEREEAEREMAEREVAAIPFRNSSPSSTSQEFPRHGQPLPPARIRHQRHQSIQQFRDEWGMESSKSSSNTSFRLRGKAVKGIFVRGFLLIAGLIACVRALIRAVRM